jgi:enediyne biosynthesis protein E4
MKEYFSFSLLCSLMLFSCQKERGGEEQPVQPLFQMMDESETNISFVNKVQDEEEFNILTYRNFYNGGGVAIGDINNDSLPDVFLTSNMGKNVLYLNKGNWKFEDISAKAGIEGTKAWSTGVAMADVNADGWLDIYVCNSGDVKGDNKENELFINNHDLTFAEKGKEYNLNNKGFSTHASFFDYDLDGDLDCYILNNSFVDPSKIKVYGSVREEVDDLGGDKLYRNDGNVFTDVTLDAGIYSSKIGFGLGVSVSDVNNDQLPDIYISNDFWERDYLYINQGKGKFKEQLTELLSICSVSSMGADIADINNDGNPEIFTTDMLAGDNYRLKAMTLFDAYHLEGLKFRGSYHYQILQNCLHLNNGNLDFQEIASLSGVSSTDWSWGALIFDFENDGFKDIFVSNGITKDIMYVDFTDFISDKDNVKKIVTEKGKFDWRDFIPHIPSNPIPNYAFVNGRNLQFKNESSALGLATPSFSNGSAYGDLDQDGDMDLVVNNVNMTAFVYQNNAEDRSKNSYLKVRLKGTEKNPFAIGSTVKVVRGEQKQMLQNYTSRGFQSSVEPDLTFGTGSVELLDTVTVIWPDKKITTLTNVKTNQAITVSYGNGMEKHVYDAQAGDKKALYKDVTANAFPTPATHRENLFNDFNQEILLLRMLSTEGPKIATGDVNGDGLDDFFLPGARNDADKLFIQQSNGSFQMKKTSVFLADSVFESTCAAFVDLDNDKALDLVVGSGGNQRDVSQQLYRLRVYMNDGKGNFTRESNDNLPTMVGNFSCIVPHDFDGDGFTDLFVGSRVAPGSYGIVPRSFVFKNYRSRLINVTPRDLGGTGMVTDAVWSDVDSDGDKDLVIVGDWMPVTIVINNNGELREMKLIPNSNGWWNSIDAGDIDGDGDDDYVLGNWGLNTKLKASVKRPLTMYTNDYDGNGKSEFIINWYPPLDTIAYPFAPKGEMLQQLPILKKSNLKYEAYAHQTYESLIPESIRSTSAGFRCEVLTNSILWNNGGGNVTLEALPLEAQVTPVFSSTIHDFDGDGKMDIWMGGNFFNLKPQVGRYNSSKGIFLKGIGDKKFNYVMNAQSGITVSGEVRDSRMVNTSKGPVLLVARNNSSVMAFKK